MDHDDVLEQIELAAVEPGGLERLMAGATPAAAAVVGHLAGCQRCAEELRRMSRAAPLLRDVGRTTPTGDLRSSTLAQVARPSPPGDCRGRPLAYVGGSGRPRGEEAAAPAPAPAAATPQAAEA